MNDKVKKILKKSIFPLIIAILYIAAVAVLAYFADKQGNGGIMDFDYSANFLLILILTCPALLMLTSALFWVVEFIKFKEYRYEKRSFAIASLICGIIFLIGVFTFIFLTLGIF